MTDRVVSAMQNMLTLFTFPSKTAVREPKGRTCFKSRARQTDPHRTTDLNVTLKVGEKVKPDTKSRMFECAILSYLPISARIYMDCTHIQLCVNTYVKQTFNVVLTQLSIQHNYFWISLRPYCFKGLLRLLVSFVYP